MLQFESIKVRSIYVNLHDCGKFRLPLYDMIQQYIWIAFVWRLYGHQIRMLTCLNRWYPESYLAHWVQFANTESVFSAPDQQGINHRLKGSESVQKLFCFVSYVVLWTFGLFTFNSFDQIGWSLGNIFETYNSTWLVAPQNSFCGLSNGKRIACGDSPENKLKCTCP